MRTFAEDLASLVEDRTPEGILLQSYKEVLVEIDDGEEHLKPDSQKYFPIARKLWNENYQLLSEKKENLNLILIQLNENQENLLFEGSPTDELSTKYHKAVKMVFFRKRTDTGFLKFSDSLF